MNKEVQRFLVAPSADLKQAMKQLEETEERTLFVVDEAGQLYGSLTDGDIRRWILSEGSLTATVSMVCNVRPQNVGITYDLERVKAVMLDKKIACIPVLNDSRQVVELLFWEKLFRDDKPSAQAKLISVPVMVMAGGKGTRLDPFTRVLPKPLIPIGDKTVIELIIESFRPYGVSTFYLSVNHKARVIKSFFEELDAPYSISYIDEEQPLGTAGGLRALVGKVHGPLIVTNCDVIIRADYADLLGFHRKSGNDITVVASLKTYRIPYGVCEIENGGRLTGMTEKPEYNMLVNTGLYVIEDGALELIPDGQMFHTTDLIGRVQSTGGQVGVYPIGEEAWLDTGEWAEYRKAVEQFRMQDIAL
jgi:dTDP-glucose pyrophosphorylase